MRSRPDRVRALSPGPAARDQELTKPSGWVATTRRTLPDPPVDVTGHTVESPASALGGRLDGDGCGLGRSVAAQAPGGGRFPCGQPGKVVACCAWLPNLAIAAATTFVGTKGPGSVPGRAPRRGPPGRPSAVSVTLPPPYSSGTSMAVQPSSAPRRHSSGSKGSASSMTRRTSARDWCSARKRTRRRTQELLLLAKGKIHGPNVSLPARCALATRCARLWPSTRHGGAACRACPRRYGAVASRKSTDADTCSGEALLAERDNSPASASDGSTPSTTSTTAFTDSPHSVSGTPITATSPTDGGRRALPPLRPGRC